MALPRRELIDGQVVAEAGIVAQAPKLDRLGNTDDSDAWHGVGIHPDALADGVLSRPEDLSHRLAHDHHQRSALSIGIEDPSAPENPGSHGLEVARRGALELEVSQALDRVDPLHVQTF